MMIEIGQRARVAARRLARADRGRKDAVLQWLATRLETAVEEVLFNNERDLEAARQAGLSPALLDRLTLTPQRIQAMASDLRQLSALPDPVGERFDERILPNGLRLYRQRVPLGVLAVIYEARPNVTVDVAGLAIKTGNAVILRGGSETLHSNRALVRLIREALQAVDLPSDAVQLIDNPDRSLVVALLQMHEFIDLLIPRGGEALHRFCRENSRIPVISGGIGICHLFVDESADVEKSVAVIRNAKVQRPSVCNALDTVLVHRKVAAEFLPRLVQELSKDGVTFRAESQALVTLQQRLGNLPPSVAPAGPKDFDTEWLSLVLGLKIVEDIDEAIKHIETHGTAHSDGILTANEANARRFVQEVDSAAVYVNASTRFTDGGQFGLGAEAAVSTQRLHARGPLGLQELTTYKWVAEGNYTVRP